jgi:hypothetical protein
MQTPLSGGLKLGDPRCSWLDFLLRRAGKGSGALPPPRRHKGKVTGKRPLKEFQGKGRRPFPPVCCTSKGVSPSSFGGNLHFPGNATADLQSGEERIYTLFPPSKHCSSCPAERERKTLQRAGLPVLQRKQISTKKGRVEKK